MRLEEFVRQPLDAYIKAERYLNDGSPSGFSQVHQTSGPTNPRSANRSFVLKQIRFDSDAFIENIGSGISNYLMDQCIFIHPDMLMPGALLDNCRHHVASEMLVSPTASGRTVLALGRNYFVKLAYPLYLGRVVRHMNAEIVRSACEVTAQLTTASGTGKLNRAFSFLRKDCGRVLHIPITDLKSNAAHLPANERGCYELGVLFREFKPFPYVEEEEYLIPCFALFGHEYDPSTQKPKGPQDKPLLIQLFEHQRKAMENFLLEDILFPLFHSYFDALLFAGVELEAHAQNVLLTINKEYAIKRIVYRDMESAGRDIPLMELLGMDGAQRGYKRNTIKAVEPGEKYPQYYITHSFMFDFKLGEYLVSPLIEVAHKYNPFDKDALEASLKAFNAQFINKLPEKFFPPDWCHYEHVNWRREKRRRTYVWEEWPKYR